MDLNQINSKIERMARAKVIIKVVKLNRWYWSYVMPSLNIDESVEYAKRLALYQYPSAKQIFIIPYFFN